MSRRLEILKNSLAKKEALFDQKIQHHIDTVKLANGQPLNDKGIKGQRTLRMWEKQNDAIRAVKDSIEVTKQAIDKEQSKINRCANTEIPEQIRNLIEQGVLVQWRKHPTFFFVNGVDRARIHLLDNGQVACRYAHEIPTQEQYAVFRDVFNKLNRELSIQPIRTEGAA